MLILNYSCIVDVICSFRYHQHLKKSSIYVLINLIKLYPKLKLPTNFMNLFSSQNRVFETLAPIPFLKLEPSRSFAKPGDNLEIECTSSVGPQVKVTWERPDRQQLPPNFEVKSFWENFLIENTWNLKKLSSHKLFQSFSQKLFNEKAFYGEKKD